MQKKKYRVYELVKEFKKSDKEVMDALKKNHIEVTSRLSGVCLLYTSPSPRD